MQPELLEYLPLILSVLSCCYLIAIIACTEVAVTETVQDVEMKCFIRNVVNGVKNVIEHVKNVDNWVKQTSI